MDFKDYARRYRNASSRGPRRADWRLRAADASQWVLVVLIAALVIGPIAEWAGR